MAKKYFHNFNGLRFYFATYILLAHIEEIKMVLHLPNFSEAISLLNRWVLLPLRYFLR